MADVKNAILFVIALEDDHSHPGCITQLRGDSGGKTRLGIAERFHPDLAAKGFYEGDPVAGSTNPLRWIPTTIPTEEGEDIAVETYETEYCAPLSLDKIGSQDLANLVLGFAVNEGLHQGVILLQRCLPGIVADGALGPKTLAAVNAATPSDLLALLRKEEEGFYAHIAANNPNLAEYAKGMQYRAEA
jgi:lysozyme family protein